MCERFKVFFPNLRILAEVVDSSTNNGNFKKQSSKVLPLAIDIPLEYSGINNWNVKPYQRGNEQFHLKYS